MSSMIRIRAAVRDKLPALWKKERAAGLEAVSFAGAYTRAILRHSIVPRAGRSSAPGHQPYDHGTFRKSMAFFVDRQNYAAYIGPKHLFDKQGNFVGIKGVPKLLEYGGTVTGLARRWFRKDAPKTTSLAAVAAYFNRQPFVPLYMAATKAQVRAQMRARDMERKDGRAAKRRGYQPAGMAHVQRRTLPARDGERNRVVYYAMLPRRSSAQAARAARLVVENYGYPVYSTFRIAARPYLRPALVKAKPSIAKIFAGTLRRRIR